MRKKISSILSIAVIFSSMSNFAYAVNEDNPEINEEYINNSVYTETESILETEIPVSKEEEHSSAINSNPTPVPDYYVMKQITERDLKIHVTKGDVPAENVLVTMNDNEQITDENGDVIFADVPVSDVKYQIKAEIEGGKRIERDVSVRGIIFLPEESEEIPEKEVNISFKNEDKPYAMSTEEHRDWQYDGLIPDKIGENYSTVIGTDIYTLKKYNPDTMYVYDTNNSVCTVINEVPPEIGTVIAVVSDNDYVYALSGSKIFRYATKAGTWSELANSQDLTKAYVFISNGNLYCINYNNLTAYDVMIYNSSGRWNTSFKLPEEIHGKIKYAYMDGGVLYCYAQSYEDNGNKLYKYNLSSKQLSCSNDNDITNDYTSYITCGKENKAYMVGGERASQEEVDDGYFDEYGDWVPDYFYEWIYEPWGSCYEYDFNDDTLEYIPDIYPESSSHSAVVCNGKLYAIGGNEFRSDTGSVIYSYELNDVYLTVPEIEENTSAVGGDHILTVNSDKTVSASGKNTYGQLGIGNTVDSDTPLLVSNLTNVASVYAGDGFSAALKYDGTVWMWGKNDCGQTGIEDIAGTLTPHKINELSDIVKLAAGKNHMLALKSDGTVFAWGGDEYSELGNLEYDDPSWFPNQVNVSDNIKVDIAVGDEHSVVLDSHGYAYVWGNNEKGQIAKAPSEVSFSRNATKVDVENVISVAAGSNHTMLLCGDGSIYTFGDNQYGQLGNSSKDGYSSALVKISSIKANKISAVKDVSYAWDINGVEYKWGLMTESEIKQKSLLNIKTPLRITQIDSYRNQTLAIDEAGQVLAWGEGYYANGSDSSTVKTYPSIIKGIDNPVQVSRGKNHNLVLDKNGDVWGWGSNSNNPMGNLKGKVKTPEKINGISNVMKVAGGAEISMFLKKDGTLWGAGKNNIGQLGQENLETFSIPVQITEKHDFKDISVGEDYVVAIAEDGVYSWGGNSKGQLGRITSSTYSDTPNKINFNLESNEKVVSVSAGIDFCLALTSLGNVYAWGNNGSGELGQGNRTASKIPVKINSLKNIKSIEAGKSSAFAMDADGKFYGWGYGADGQLISYESTLQTPALINGLNGLDIAEVSLGYDFTIALGNNGELYTCGKMGSGKLGYYASEPIAVDSEIIRDTKWLSDYMRGISQPISQNISLPDTAPNGSTIVWKSGNTAYLSDTGTLTARPDCYGSDTDIAMYAVIKNGESAYKPTYNITVKQDTSIKPSTNIPIRAIGMEYEQCYPENTPDVYPEITGVSLTLINKEKRIYQLTVADNQFKSSNLANPFFFWNSRQGTFLKVDDYENYRSVQFTVDHSEIDETVKVVVGVGDGLGYADKKYILINPPNDENSLNTESAAVAMSEDLEVEGNQVALSIGIDTSLNMKNFDSGSTKSWMNSVEGLIESAETGVKLALVTNNEVGYPVNVEAGKEALDMIKSNPYAGETDALSLLEKCADSLDDKENIPQQANKVIVLFVNKDSDKDKLKNKIAELEEQGISVYIMMLTNESIGKLESSNNIYLCDSELKLRLNISELYASFAEVAQLMTADTEDADNYHYKSDLKEDKHLFKISNNNVFGSMIASVLNLYGCLPVYIENGYNLLDKNNPAVNDVKNIVFKNACSVSTESSNKIAEFYNNKKNEYSAESVPNITYSGSLYDQNIVSLIDKNLNYRFPVVIFNDSNSYIITGKKSDGEYTVNGTENTVVSGSYNIIDTHSYLMKIAAKENIEDQYNYTEKFYDKIEISVPTVPTAYTNNDVIFVNCNNKLSISLVVINGIATLSSISDGEEYVAGIKTSYTGIIPNVYNSSKYYKVIQYADKQDNIWYYKYLFKATNADIIKGIEQNNEIQFMPEKKLSRAELITMLMRAVDADVSSYNTLSWESAEKLYDGIIEAVKSGVTTGNLVELGLLDINEIEKSSYISFLQSYLSNESFNWAKEYMNFAYTKGLINEYQYLGLDYFTNHDIITKEDSDTDKQIIANAGGCNIKVRRDDAAYIICDMLVRNILEVTVPLNVYKYSKDISCERNAYWNTDTAFVDVTRSYPFCIEEIYQMYMNGLMEGDTERRFNPDKILTRAEACAVIVRSLFSLDEGLEKVDVLEKGSANYIDFNLSETRTITQALDRSGSGEFYFVAPKTGYYYIENIHGCTVDLQNEIRSIVNDLNDFSCNIQRYLVRKGEIIKIKVLNVKQESYAFDITRAKDNDIVFMPKEDGNYIFTNHPEQITDNDLADADLGNTLLLTEKGKDGNGVTGNVVVHMTHQTDISIWYDIALYNPSNKEVKIKVNKFGWQVPEAHWYDNDTDVLIEMDDPEAKAHTHQDENDWTTVHAWADYFGTPLY